MEKEEMITQLLSNVKEVCPAKLMTITFPMRAVFGICNGLILFDGKNYRWLGSYQDLKQRAIEIYSKNLEELRKEYEIEEKEEEILKHIAEIPEWKKLENDELIKKAERTIELLRGWWNKLGILEGVKYADIEIFVDPFIKKKNLDSEEIILFKESLHLEQVNRETKREKQLIGLIRGIVNGISEEEFEKEKYLNPKYMGYDGYSLYSREELEEMNIDEMEKEFNGKNKTEPGNALKKLKEKIEITEEEEENIRITRFLSYLLDERRYFANMLNMCLHILAEEFSKRMKIEKNEFYKLTYWEFLEAIKGKKIEVKLPRVFWGYECKELVANEVGNIFEEIENEIEKRTEKERILKGFGVSSGKVKGRVKVILDPREESINEGEILVTYYTNPEYVPLMKKAGGIITEFGGVTSHAAIVSREFGKPCIVGVKNAVASLREGELIEIDGHEGTIEIIE